MRNIEPILRSKIEQKLTEIEKEFSVKIILAIESGSRAWGFESTDSDYDVRFIYKHDFKWYINVLPKRDVIELPIVDLDDYSGWDIRKSLFLINKSNPVFFEWLKSPIVYFKDEKNYSIILEAANKYFSPIPSVYHYLSMAGRNYREHLKQEKVKTKKYFYALRPLLACQWIKDKNESPPMEFEYLLENGIEDKKVISIVNDLLRKKKAGVELGEDKRIDLLNEFIENKILNFEEYTKLFNPADKPDSKYLDDLLYEIIKPDN